MYNDLALPPLIVIIVKRDTFNFYVLNKLQQLGLSIIDDVVSAKRYLQSSFSVRTPSSTSLPLDNGKDNGQHRT